ncbi:MAG: hypothetical protein J5882_00280 [Bacteroidales bacterium]|nr:hypothetical protein [Bacteroidales bacterium]
MQEIDFQDLLIDAWNKFKERWKPLCVASLIGYFLPFLLFMGGYVFVLLSVMSASRYGQVPEFPMPVLFSLAVLVVVLMLFNVGTENYCMKICRGDNPTTKDFFLPFNTYVRLMGAELLCAIAVVIGVAVCFIPGLILGFFFTFVSYAVIDHPELGIMDCIKHSWKLVKQYWKPILILLMINYAIQSVIGGTVIGLIPAVPFGILLISLLYTKFNDETAASSQQQLPPTIQA